MKPVPLRKAELIKALRMISERAHAAKSENVWEKIGGIQYLADHALGFYDADDSQGSAENRREGSV